ncbi:MAG TPA: PRC-barrel domain-containing protein [Hyphomicrobiaceae bacterium]|jgi:hypothetical protein|nr:PRC-barrel domain-containing protein [Hyphomicrobiaceae bacterium]
MKTIIAATAVTLGLAVSPLALAQTNSTPQAPPSATSPGTTSQTKTPPATSPQATAPSTSRTASAPQWYSHQAGEMRASKLIGTTVKNNANESIGEINEIMLGKDGKVAAVVVGVGGFLGMGEREVAIDFDSLKVTSDSNNKMVVTLNTTKDALKSAPAWQWTNNGTSTSGRTTTTTTPPPKR